MRDSAAQYSRSAGCGIPGTRWRSPVACLSILCAVLLTISSSVFADGSLHYSYREAGRDGIGKVYLGREIAHVMGHRGAGWLERPERVGEERTDVLLTLLPLSPGDTVADIGAGTGYFSLPMALEVGMEGQVLAVDIQPEMLSIIEQRMQRTNITNITPILATETNPHLPAGDVDLVLLVDAYHEFSHPFEVMSHVVDALSEGGRVILVEYRGEDPSVPIKPLHKMTIAQAEKEMVAVGLELDQVLDDLPWQHVMVFRRAAVATAR